MQFYVFYGVFICFHCVFYVFYCVFMCFVVFLYDMYSGSGSRLFWGFFLKGKSMFR